MSPSKKRFGSIRMLNPLSDTEVSYEGEGFFRSIRAILVRLVTGQQLFGIIDEEEGQVNPPERASSPQVAKPRQVVKPRLQVVKILEDGGDDRR